MRGFYTTHEAATLLQVSLPTVVNWIKARRLKAHRTPGGHRRIARAELAAFMLRHGMPLPDELSDAAQERRKALVLGHEGPQREGLVRLLAAAGYAVEQASPGFGGGLALARFEPDVVVLEARAPDGGEPLRDLLGERESGGIPVVAVGPPAWLPDLLRAGCAAAVPHPLSDGLLQSAVDQALARVTERRRGAPGRVRD
ncbi:MAG: excisionase family DNA-binding protein [Deltaproteobacteria bacterium]|nr:excisionase family DNA-binding protein [Deltaproteobacteria bacterium]